MTNRPAPLHRASDTPLVDATADADGAIDAIWTIPATTGAVPRAYGVDASGGNPGGGTHTARMAVPLVAYPETAPCAVADSASTVLGAAVQVNLLANDVAPTGGSLDTASLAVHAAGGGSFEVDATTGAVTFTPDAGFWGTVQTSYVVYDGWGIGVQADLRVTVDAGCTVTGTKGVTLIEGTEGDDVICVPDRDDRRAFHVIDAKGGNDVILGGAGVEWIYGGDGADVIYGNGGDDRIVAGAGIDTVRGGAGMDAVYSVDTADAVIDDDYEMVLSPSATVAQSGPVPEPDWVWADVAEAVEIDVLANDHDPNEDLDPATLRIAAAPASGTASVAQDADARTVVRYTASATDGTDSFGYEVCDALGNCATAEVTVMAGTANCTIVGTPGDDTIRGTPGDDVICGLGGDDTIRGIGGDDIDAGDGDDIAWGGPGDDTLDGGPGDDTVIGGGGNDLIWGGPGDDTLDGHAGNDTIWGGPGDDVLEGATQNDYLWGGPGDDVLDGQGHDDELHGGPGDDTLRGGAGDDRLWGGIDADSLDGGNGTDHADSGEGADSCTRASTTAGCEPGGGAGR